MDILESIQTFQLRFNPTYEGRGAIFNSQGSFLTKKQINKIKHTENGNIGLKKKKVIKNLKILHLNKGSKFLVNSNEMINKLIIEEDPEFFYWQNATLITIMMRKKLARPLKIII